MRKREFLDRLAFSLSSTEAKERKNILSYFEELIDDKVDSGYSEEKVIAELGSIDSIVKRLSTKDFEAPLEKNKIRTEKINRKYIRYGSNNLDDEKLEISRSNIREISDSKERKPRIKGNNDRTAVIIILVITAPIWLSLLIALIAIFVALIITSVAVAFSFFITAIALVISGFAGVLGGLLQINSPTGLLLLGSGVILIGIGLILGPIFYKVGMTISRGLVKTTGWMLRRIGGKA